MGVHSQVSRPAAAFSVAPNTILVCRTTKELYAVKVIQRKGLKPEDDENVLNEVAVMQSLSADANKFVVQLLDFYEEDEYFYLVMEYCPGGDVFDRIVKYVQYTEMDARALAITLLRAVQSIHAAGLAHRDIKPQNLFLLDKEDNASIRVGDFGFSKRVHTPESLTSRVGTPTYVAPEYVPTRRAPLPAKIQLTYAYCIFTGFSRICHMTKELIYGVLV